VYWYGAVCGGGSVKIVLEGWLYRKWVEYAIHEFRVYPKRLTLDDLDMVCKRPEEDLRKMLEKADLDEDVEIQKYVKGDVVDDILAKYIGKKVRITIEELD